MIGANNNYIITNRVDLFKGWLNVINCTLSKKGSLTESELEILTYLLYYNDKYKSITEDETRFELLFSPSVKRKMKEEFNVDSQKLETYLNKLRKKGVIASNNTINPKFIIYPEDTVFISFTFQLNNIQPQIISSPKIDTQVPEPITNIVSTEEIVERIVDERETIQKYQEHATTTVTTSNIWDKYMEAEKETKAVSWNTGLDD